MGVRELNIPGPDQIWQPAIFVGDQIRSHKIYPTKLCTFKHFGEGSHKVKKNGGIFSHLRNILATFEIFQPLEKYSNHLRNKAPKTHLTLMDWPRKKTYEMAADHCQTVPAVKPDKKLVDC